MGEQQIWETQSSKQLMNKDETVYKRLTNLSQLLLNNECQKTKEYLRIADLLSCEGQWEWEPGECWVAEQRVVFKERSSYAKSFQAVKHDSDREMSIGFGNLEITRDFELVVSLEGWGQKAGVRRLKSTQHKEVSLCL